MEYYLRFVERFPTVEQLAAASEDEVLLLWQGLGYYSRARNLLTAARQVVARGAFPNDYAEVRQLKGVGDYTAAAICSFAYNQPYAVVDGNVYRILTRFFGIATPIDSVKGKKDIAKIAQQLMEAEGVQASPREHNSAMMDFGALQCVPHQLDCARCPLMQGCYAYEHGAVGAFPVKQKRLEVRHRYMVYVYLELPNGNTLLHRRANNDIWAGLYEPFLLEFEKPPTDKKVVEELVKHFPLQRAIVKKTWKGVRHQLTHRQLHIDFWTLRLDDDFVLEHFIEVTQAERQQLATPRVVQQFYEQLRDEVTSRKK